jgi:hypothetical protein
MRIFLGLLAVLISAQAPFAAEARRTAISELIQKPADYFDQRLLVTGVVDINPWGPDLCPLPSVAPLDEARCIDLHDVNLPFYRFDRFYDGAIVEVAGYFTHGCYVPPNNDPDGVQPIRLCIHRGVDGWITIESMRVVGAANSCAQPVCDPDLRVTEVDLSSPEAVGIGALASKVIRAARQGRASEMLALMLPSLRAEMNWLFELGDERVRDSLTAPDLARSPASSAEPGSGYRLIRIVSENSQAYEKLCFCTTKDCAKFWAYAGLEPRALRRLPFRCFDVARTEKGWSVF